MIYIDEAACIQGFIEHMTLALQKVADRLLGVMQTKIGSNGPPGRSEWHQELQAAIKVTQENESATSIDFKVGLPFTAKLDPARVRALLINYGSGSRGLFGIRIMTQPNSLVWNDDLSGMKLSDAVTTYALPDGFNQAGNAWLQSAMKEIEPIFVMALQDAWTTFDLSKYVKSTGKIGR